jgi:hypothetical protein
MFRGIQDETGSFQIPKEEKAILYWIFSYLINEEISSDWNLDVLKDLIGIGKIKKIFVHRNWDNMNADSQLPLQLRQ